MAKNNSTIRAAQGRQPIDDVAVIVPFGVLTDFENIQIDLDRLGSAVTVMSDAFSDPESDQKIGGMLAHVSTTIGGLTARLREAMAKSRKREG